MRAIGFERPEQLGGLFIADAEQLREWTAGAEPLVDDRPRRILARTATPGGTSPEYAAWFDTDAARERFARSEWVARRWPDALRSASLPSFALQHAVNHAAFNSFALDRDVEPLHAALTESELRSPVLWLLDSDLDAQRAARAAQAATPDDPAVLRHLAVGALAERRYGEAAELFGRAEARSAGGSRRDLFRLQVYALCLAGRVAEADRLAEARYAERGPGPLPPFWGWLRSAFGLDPSRASASRAVRSSQAPRASAATESASQVTPAAS
jgi:hypothetical protein